MNDTPSCVFCRIVAGGEPASVIFEDDVVMAFMGIRPIRPGECMVIPKHDPFDITSARFAYLEDGEIKFGMKNVPFVDRTTLDEHAKMLRIEDKGLGR